MFYLITHIFFLIFLCSSSIINAEDLPRPTICLNMIVKNESKVITRCLASMLPIINYWVIVDTGSEDDTKKIIEEFMQKHGVKGEIDDRPWVNFSHNRNEALKLAQGKGDYVFFMDADDFLVYDSDFKLPQLEKDYYNVFINHSELKYSRIMLINNHKDWKWVGVLHEVLVAPPLSTFSTLEKVICKYTSEGARSQDPQKYYKDAQILENALKNEPNNSRYVFYLARSYSDAGDYAKALKNYEKRVTMGGWDQEIFYSLFQIGLMQELLQMPLADVIQSHNRAYQYRKSRVEPLYQIARLHRIHGEYELGYQIAKLAQTLPISKDALFVQHWVYDYSLPLERSICAYWIGNYLECQQISLEILKKENLPEDIKTCVQRNLEFANVKLLEPILKKSILAPQS